MSICSIEGCFRKHKALGWCNSHYYRWRRNGDPMGGRVVPGEPESYYFDVVLSYEGDECLPWPFAKRCGYGVLNGQSVTRRICTDANGPPPTPRHHAAHSCGNGHKGCCAKRHLSWKTPKENQEDRLIHGTHDRGERSANAKLTENDVREIRALISFLTQKEIAERYGVAPSRISRIKRRKNWAWLTEMEDAA